MKRIPMKQRTVLAVSFLLAVTSWFIPQPREQAPVALSPTPSSTTLGYDAPVPVPPEPVSAAGLPDFSPNPELLLWSGVKTTPAEPLAVKVSEDAADGHAEPESAAESVSVRDFFGNGAESQVRLQFLPISQSR